MSIVITGASGQLGRLTAELVLARVPASEVTLTTRRPEALSDFVGRGARVRQADFDRPEAFAGGERVLLISADVVGRRVAQHRSVIEAAREAGVRHVAYTSYLNPVEENPAVITARPKRRCGRADSRGPRCATPSTPSTRSPPARRRSPRVGSLTTKGRARPPTFRARTAPQRPRRSSLPKATRAEPTTSPGRNRSARATWRRC